MKFRFLILLAAAGVLAACAKEETGTSESGNNGKVVAQFGAGISNVKTTLSPAENAKRKIFWAEGDCIAINGLASEPLTEETAGGVTAVFDFTSYYTTPGNVLYPSVMYKDENTITLPSSQAYVADGFASGAYPMAAHFESGSDATLSALCAMIKLPLKQASGTSPDTDRISTITFSGNAGEQVRGDFVIDYENATLTPASDAEEDKSFTMNVGKTPGAEPLPIVLIVPAGTYASGFSLKIMDVAGHYMVMSKETSFSVEAGHLYVMPEVEFIPTGTELGVEISSAADLVAFAQNYNSKAVSANAIATLTADIEFDAESSAAFNATGGIGMKEKEYSDTEDYYFDGLLNGNGKTISGLASTVSLFKAIGSSGKVQDLTLDSSCSFTFTHGNFAEMFAAAIVGYHRGILDNVKNAADVSLAPMEDVAFMTTVGGLAGRVTVGSIINCEYSGLISTPSDFTGTEKLIIGGLVGRFTNEGTVKDSYFKGAISNEARIASTDKGNPYIIIGGFAGHVNGGALISNSATTADHALVPGAYSGSSGIIVNKTTQIYNSAVGGIAGEIANGTVADCANGASIMNTLIRQSDDDLILRYMETGGIVGKNGAEGTVSNCVNNATVYHRSNPRIQRIGGIVGSNEKDGTVSGCTNNADVAQMTTGVDGDAKLYGGRVISIGGVIGDNYSSNVSDLHNIATITVSRTEAKAKAKVEVSMGGVIGSNSAAIDGGEEQSITNTGKVYYNTNMSVEPIGYNLGGIVGKSTSSVANVINSGYVHFNWSANAAQKAYLGGVVGYMGGDGEISGCVNLPTAATNSAEVNLYVNVDAAHKNCFAGGILGYADHAVSIVNCSNSGYVHGAPNKKYSCAEAMIYVGGIVGCLTGASVINDCENTGYTNLNSVNNTDDDVTKIFADGGIAGCVQGTEEHPVEISDCSWTYTTADVGSRRGTCGGVAAYAEWANISGCEVNVSYNMYNRVTGGIVGWAVHSNLTGCKFRGAKIAASQGYFSGGIVAKLKDGSVVDGCYNFCTDITATKAPTVIGEIAAVSDKGTVIQNCHYTGTIAICSDDNFTNGGGNVPDALDLL